MIWEDELSQGFDGVGNGTRTHDNRNHNPGLYQLSYSHHQIYGPPDRIRTCDPRLRRPMLYPAELQTQSCKHCLCAQNWLYSNHEPMSRLNCQEWWFFFFFFLKSRAHSYDSVRPVYFYFPELPIILLIFALLILLVSILVIALLLISLVLLILLISIILVITLIHKW